MDIQKIYNRLRPLVQYRKKSDEELWDIAKSKAIQEDRDLDIVSRFKNKEERRIAKDLLHRYLEDFSIETISDKNTLKELIFNEVSQIRLQTQINKFYEDSNAVPLELMDAVHKNSDHILKLKNSLGLNKSKEGKTPYDALRHLIKRHKKWREDNQASRTLTCPHCSKMILLKIRTAIWEAQRHPFFKDKILFNEHLVKIYIEGKVTKKEVSLILECSPDYIEHLVEKMWKSNPKYQEIQDEVLESGEIDV